MDNEEQKEIWEFEKTEESDDQEKDTLAYEISYYPTDLTLKGYLDKWESGQLVVPDFQRSYVWDQVQASKLIESFLMGLPVPGVFLYKERKTNKLMIVDGQQRIFSAINYLKGIFNDKAFRLKNVDDKWEGKTFEELSEPDRFTLHDAMLRATVIQQLEPSDDSSVFLVFERLNTGGVKLNAMEVRKCVYYGAFFKFIEKINENNAWREILGKPAPDKRLRDAELILRVISLVEDLADYDKPMKGYLNKCLKKINKMPDDEIQKKIEELNKKFVYVCNLIVKSLGEKPFHLRGRLNYAVLDSVLSTLMINFENIPKDVQERFQQLKNDDEYINAVSISTSDLAVVKNRFEKAKQYLIL